MTALITRFVLGCAALAAVWFAAWSFDSGSYLPLLGATLGGVLASAVASRVAVALKKRRRRDALVFALPFVFPSAISALALFDGSVRPFLFWICAGLAAFLVALATDLLIFSLIKPDEEKA